LAAKTLDKFYGHGMTPNQTFVVNGINGKAKNFVANNDTMGVFFALVIDWRNCYFFVEHLLFWFRLWIFVALYKSSLSYEVVDLVV
jgi:hypothetical protein